jgi:Txe/YoeB family toxin of Txe-Axe toxin-antitoxin module
LLRSINKARDLLKKNPFAGNQIQKRLIPERYKKLYDVENLWRIELANRWRLIYTIYGNEIEIINFVVDIFDHKKYDKVFGYKH